MLREPAPSAHLNVAPYAGAWIEITRGTETGWDCEVAPYAGAWIEMVNRINKAAKRQSLPTRERGLKSVPLATTNKPPRRSLRGSVD